MDEGWPPSRLTPKEQRSKPVWSRLGILVPLKKVVEDFRRSLGGFKKDFRGFLGDFKKDFRGFLGGLRFFLEKKVFF